MLLGKERSEIVGVDCRHLVFSVTQNEGSQIKPQIQTIQQEIEKLLL